MTYFAYIVTTRKGGPLYTDVAPDLANRGCPKREAAQSGFGTRSGDNRNTGQHTGRQNRWRNRADDQGADDEGVEQHHLVYYEKFPDLLNATRRERVIRRWNRDGKIMRIEAVNPDWSYLADDARP
jgi:putative endonuclease